jgi:hypothetical protein
LSTCEGLVRRCSPIQCIVADSSNAGVAHVHAVTYNMLRAFSFCSCCRCVLPAMSPSWIVLVACSGQWGHQLRLLSRYGRLVGCQ